MLLNTASRRLSAKLDLAYPALRAQAQCLWSSADVRDMYPLYLKTMHRVVRSAVPLMEAAIACAKDLPGDDRLAVPLIEYFSAHKEEERGHDLWLLQDIEATGHDIQDVFDKMPSPRIAEMIGAQYYWLQHHHPVALVGHIAALEGYHPPLGFAARLSELTGFESNAFRAIARHEKLDIVHRQELHAMIDALPLTARHEHIMGVSGLHTMQGAVDVLDELLHNHHRTKETLSA